MNKEEAIERIKNTRLAGAYRKKNWSKHLT